MQRYTLDELFKIKPGIDINIISYSVKEKAFNNTSAIKKNKFVSMSQKKKIDKNYVLGFQECRGTYGIL